MSVEATAGDQAGLQRQRLHAHVGEQVDGRLLHARRSEPRSRDRDCCRGPRTTGRCRRRTPARRSRAGRASARGSRCPARRSSRSPAGSSTTADGRVGQADQAAGPEAVVEILVPLVAERAVGQRRPTARRRESAMDVLRQKRILPSAAGTVMAVGAAVDREDRAGQRVLGRPPSAGGLKRGSRHVPVQRRRRDRSSRWRASPCSRPACDTACRRRRCCSPSASSRRPRCR